MRIEIEGNYAYLHKLDLHIEKDKIAPSSKKEVYKRRGAYSNPFTRNPITILFIETT